MRCLSQYNHLTRCARYPNFAWVAQSSAGSVWQDYAGILAVQHKRDRAVKKSWDTDLNLVFSDNFFSDDQMSVLLPRSHTHLLAMCKRFAGATISQ